MSTKVWIVVYQNDECISEVEVFETEAEAQAHYSGILRDSWKAHCGRKKYPGDDAAYEIIQGEHEEDLWMCLEEKEVQ